LKILETRLAPSRRFAQPSSCGTVCTFAFAMVALLKAILVVVENALYPAAA
jgi:hypothetical protein